MSSLLNQKQKTLAKACSFVGKGLHSGRIVKLEVLPAAAGAGISFLRTDVENAKAIPALYSEISATDLCTTIGSGACSVATIEHLMAAFAGLGVDNAFVKLNGPEVPIMDGSSEPFVCEFSRVGLVEQNARRRFFVVKESFELQLGSRTVRIEPARESVFFCEIDFGKGFIGRQNLEFKLSPYSFKALSRARTFCHVNEVNALRSVGLALGGSLENAVVVDDAGVLNPEGLRVDDEFVRHKVLDCIGDLYLLGGQIVGRVRINRPGHGFHAEIMNQMMLNKTKYFVQQAPHYSPEAEAEEDLALVGGLAFG